MNALSSTLEQQPIVYVTRDIERAFGLPLDTRGYFIISNFSESVKEQTKDLANVLLLKKNKLLDTHELLSHPETEQFLSSINNAHILVFKNTLQIERICKERNWPLLNPSAAIANRIEEKISQIDWLGELTDLLPPHTITTCKELSWDGTPFILQFNRAHTGSGTLYISSPEQLDELNKKFPERPVRKTAFVRGTMLTSNNIVTDSAVLVGNVSVQITGLAPFTDHPFATVGNDWGLAKNILAPRLAQEYNHIVEAVGHRMRSDGWSGLFGVDIMLGEMNDKLYLIEINARQPASTTFESQLQRKTNTNGNTVFEAHLAALSNLPLKHNSIINITDGAQLILRNQQGISLTKDRLAAIAQTLTAQGYAVTLYDNTAPGSDLVRIQSTSSFLASPATLNKNGETILAALRDADFSFVI